MGIECDIQRSGDGLAMVFHDWDLDRLTDGSGSFSGMSAAQIGELTLTGSAQRPALLEVLLQLIDGRVPLLIEIKSLPGYDVERTCEKVSEALAGYSGPVAAMSFDPRVAPWFRTHSPELPSGLVVREDTVGYTQTIAEREEALRYADPDFLAYHVLALPNERVAQLREEGLPILTWTVNSPETRATALAHADAIVSEGEGLA